MEGQGGNAPPSRIWGRHAPPLRRLVPSVQGGGGGKKPPCFATWINGGHALPLSYFFRYFHYQFCHLIWYANIMNKFWLKFRIHAKGRQKKPIYCELMRNFVQNWCCIVTKKIAEFRATAAQKNWLFCGNPTPDLLTNMFHLTLKHYFT